MVGIVGTVAASEATFQLQFRCELTTRLYFTCTYARGSDKADEKPGSTAG
jgi:hypothetical protein